MYLHLGEDCSVAVSRIVAILDMNLYEHAEENPFEKEAQAYSERLGRVPRSVILTSEALYFSVISVQSLKKRIESPCYRETLHDFAV